MKAGAVCCLRTILRLFTCVKICVVESPSLLARARCCDNVFETLRGFGFHLFQRDPLTTDGNFKIIRVWADNACNKKDTFFVLYGLRKKWNVAVLLFYAVAAETYWWMLAQLQMEESFQHSRNDCCRWENGCLSMVRLFTARNPGELRMIPLTKTCGKFKIFTKVKIGPLVHFSTGRLASFSEYRRVHNKRRNLHRGKTL